MLGERAREIDEHAEHDRLMILQGSAMSLTTCLAIGTAVEGYAAAQHGHF